MNAKHALFGLLFLAGCSAPGSEPAALPPTTNGASTSALDLAHQAYLDGDLLTMSDRIRDVLLDSQSSDIVKTNAYELLDKAYELKNGNLPSRWTPPVGISGLKYSLVDVLNGGNHYYAFYLYGRLPDPTLLAAVSVKVLPDQTILDSSDASTKLRIGKEGSLNRFLLEKSDIPALPPDGVIAVHFTLKDGTTSDTWFISHGQHSSGNPEIKTPLPASALRAAPLVTWTPFRSPENAAYEHRTLSLWVGSGNGEHTAFDQWRQDYMDLASMQVGDLARGDYWLNLTCGEYRQFGAFQLSRDSRSNLPFHIVP